MKLAYSLDEGHAKTAAGLIVLSTDETIEVEVGGLLRDNGVTPFVSRIPSTPDVTPETLALMAEHLPASAALFPPPAKLPVIGYGCTSGATVIGSDRVAALVQQSQPAAQVFNPLSAICAGFERLGARRIGFLSPYGRDVSATLIEALEQRGFTVAAFETFDEPLEARVARIDAHSVIEGLKAVATDSVDVLFASCTNLRTFPVIDVVEAATGKPVISSNLALGWQMLQALRIRDKSGPGQLLRV